MSKSARWHLNRRKEILAKYPSIASIPKYDSYAIIPIIGAPLAHFGLAYCSQYLNVVVLCIVAWTIGSACTFAMFNYSHELAHHLVHPKIKGRLYNTLLHYASILSLSPSTYVLFKFGHKPHHANLGVSSVSTAKKFLSEKYPDIELLIDRYYFELMQNDNEMPRSLHPFLFKNKILRLLSISIIFPISSAVKGIFLSHIAIFIAFTKCVFTKRAKLYRERVIAIFIQICLLYGVLSVLYLLAGPLAFLYLFVSELSQRGLFFHPITIFPMTSHKAWQNQQTYQPTTSTYHWLVSLVLMRLNYHVEHHDFPDIPCRYLPKVKKSASEFYDNLKSFNGVFDILTQYYRSEHWYYAGASSNVQ